MCHKGLFWGHFFLIYIYDLINVCSHCLLILFADDTSLFVSEIICLLLVKPKKLSIWFARRKNISDNHKFSETKSSKFIGVYIDDSLNWKKHTCISYVLAKFLVEKEPLLKVDNTLTRKVYGLYVIVLYTPSWYIIIMYGEILKQTCPSCRYYKTDFCESLLVLSLDAKLTPCIEIS